MIESNDTW
jgi:dihydrolipoamide dehydrogenase